MSEIQTSMDFRHSITVWFPNSSDFRQSLDLTMYIERPKTELPSSVIGHFTFGLVPDSSVFGQHLKSERFHSDFGQFLTSAIQTIMSKK